VEDAVPKINVYLPDDLAAAVRDARIPVSAVCQQALADALQQVTAATEAARAFDEPSDEDMPLGGGRATPRLRTVVKLARASAREAGSERVGTEHLLLGVLDERENLAVRVIETLDVDLDDLRTELDALIAQGEADGAGGGGRSKKVAQRPRLTPIAKDAFRHAVDESIRMGHNYIGCEHLLLGLVAEEEGLAGRVLRSMGVDKTVARRTTVSLLTGFMYARKQGQMGSGAAPAAGTDAVVREILERLSAIERKLV
jgi:ATP-dependent Clp protease ATP-binding subunit ClpC